MKSLLDVTFKYS